jgi:medium-chain acyl-[acyl-carrier-protein] hydrolase
MPTSSHWLICPQPNSQARLRLFCFPYAGGGTVIYRPWAAGLPETIELWCVRLPGRESFRMSPPFARVGALVEALTPAILPYLDAPFAFFGHSMGGLISFELIHTLRRAHAPAPVRFFVSAHHAPQLPDRTPPLHHLPDAELLTQLRRLNGTPEAVLQDRELMQLFLPVLRADFAVCETYTYTPRTPLTCPISAFGGSQDPRVSHDEMAAWRAQTHSAFIHRTLPGDHFFLHSAQTQLLQAIVQDLTHDLNATGVSGNPPRW